MRHSAACCPSATTQSHWLRGTGLASYADGMLELDAIDVEEIATALADQTDFEHRWLIDPRTGEVVFWTSDTGIDGENPVEIEELAVSYTHLRAHETVLDLVCRLLLE